MKQLKPRDKVTQHMTRDGLTLDNQTTGESINISSREAEQDYSAAEPGGTAEKVLERAGDIRERSKAKRAAKDGANTAAQATGPASRLQFTAEEWADPALSKYVHKAEKRADKLDAAKEALPKKRVVTTETVYDEAKGKAKTKLHFDKVEKPATKLKPNPASRPMEEAGLYLHGKIHEVEHENVGVEGGHKGEELAERQAGKAIRSGIRRHKLKPYRAAAKAERKSIAANAEFAYQKSLRDNPELAQAAGKARAYTVDVETIFENLLQDMTAVRDTVGDGCEMVIAMSAKVAGKLDLAKGGSHILESGTFQQGSVELKVKELDGCPIIRVPSARFQTKYTFLDGVEKAEGGFAAAADAKGINWIIMVKQAPVAISKTDVTRIFDPMTNQNANAWKIDYRKYHDLWIADNSMDGVFLNVSA